MVLVEQARDWHRKLDMQMQAYFADCRSFMSLYERVMVRLAFIDSRRASVVLRKVADALRCVGTSQEINRQISCDVKRALEDLATGIATASNISVAQSVSIAGFLCEIESLESEMQMRRERRSSSLTVMVGVVEEIEKVSTQSLTSTRLCRLLGQFLDACDLDAWMELKSGL